MNDHSNEAFNAQDAFLGCLRPYREVDALLKHNQVTYYFGFANLMNAYENGKNIALLHIDIDRVLEELSAILEDCRNQENSEGYPFSNRN